MTSLKRSHFYSDCKLLYKIRKPHNLNFQYLLDFLVILPKSYLCNLSNSHYLNIFYLSLKKALMELYYSLPILPTLILY